MDVHNLAHALAMIGAADIEDMAWSPFKKPTEWIDADRGEQALQEFPMQSLALAILAQLPTPAHEPTDC